jgi:hypothetical protein
MCSRPDEEADATEIAMQKLAKAIRVVSANSELFYLKKPADVTETALRDVDSSFSEIEALMSEFADEWYDSRNQGFGAVRLSENLNDRIDVKLCQNGKLDFQQMKRIVLRLNAIDDVMVGLDRISLYIKRYGELCRDKLLGDLAEHAQHFEASILNELRRSVESEARRLRNQIERCNLYYQPAMKTKTHWVALVSLGISSLAFLLTILRMLNYI